MSKRSLKYLLPALLWAFTLVLSFAFSTKDEDIRFVQPEGWPKPFYDLSKNKVTTAGFELGRKLFYDPRLSGDGSISCGSCHMQVSGFAHAGNVFSHGMNGAKGRRNSPTLFNLAWNTSFMWDGGVNNLEVQPLAPMSSVSEMGTTLESIVRRLGVIPEYRSGFYLTFGDSAITGQRVLKALAQFTVMLESYNSRYDRYVRKEQGGTLTNEEQHGLKLFRKHCETCHNEPLFTNNSFQNIGLPIDTTLNDYGRLGIIHDMHDSLKFKTPSLRNVAVSAPYMHDGRFATLMQVLDHYTNG
ncbi:MAG: Cytochrome-c peroxidase, partial [Flavipsychrobacter sp.]|nr:Cytochrome-c peroxidase [Flavipsychrobacter sp.]